LTRIEEPFGWARRSAGFRGHAPGGKKLGFKFIPTVASYKAGSNAGQMTAEPEFQQPARCDIRLDLFNMARDLIRKV
jgi:hypothetical protein